MDAGFWNGVPVAVLGGSGFLGWHLLDALIRHGASVRDLSLATPRIPHAEVEYRIGDVRDSNAVRETVAGTKVVFVLAGPVGTDLSPELMDAHSRGVSEVLAALPSDARLVVTSSILAVGSSRDRTPLTESAPFNLRDFRSGYVQAKRRGEETALAAAAQRDIVVVNPGYLFGPVDPGTSVMGRFCIRMWRGNIPFTWPGGLNAVDVRDVAAGHLLAAERGTRGTRYILGGENVTHRELALRMIAAAGRRRRAFPQCPGWLFSAGAAIAEAGSHVTGKPASFSRETARIARRFWYFDSTRAKNELGFAPRPLDDTLADAFAWHAAQTRVAPRGLNGLLMPRRVALNLCRSSGIISK
jgi:dihydroflavonol-4-reductase